MAGGSWELWEAGLPLILTWNRKNQKVRRDAISGQKGRAVAVCVDSDAGGDSLLVMGISFRV